MNKVSAQGVVDSFIAMCQHGWGDLSEPEKVQEMASVLTEDKISSVDDDLIINLHTKAQEIFNNYITNFDNISDEILNLYNKIKDSNSEEVKEILKKFNDFTRLPKPKGLVSIEHYVRNFFNEKAISHVSPTNLLHGFQSDSSTTTCTTSSRRVTPAPYNFTLENEAALIQYRLTLIKNLFAYDKNFLERVFKCCAFIDSAAFSNELRTILLAMESIDETTIKLLNENCGEIYRIMNTSKYSKDHHGAFAGYTSKILNGDPLLSEMKRMSIEIDQARKQGQGHPYKKNKTCKELFKGQKTAPNQSEVEHKQQPETPPNSSRNSDLMRWGPLFENFVETEQAKNFTNPSAPSSSQFDALDALPPETQFKVKDLIKGINLDLNNLPSENLQKFDLLSAIDPQFFVSKDSKASEPMNSEIIDRSPLINVLKKNDGGVLFDSLLGSICDLNEPDELTKIDQHNKRDKMMNNYDECGLTLLHHVILQACPEGIGILAKYDANLNKRNLNEKREPEFSPLRFVRRMTYAEDVKLRMIEELLKYGVFPKVRESFHYYIKKALEYKNDNLLFEVIKIGGLIGADIVVTAENNLKTCLDRFAHPLLFGLKVNDQYVQAIDNFITDCTSLKSAIDKELSPGKRAVFLVESFYQLVGAIRLQNKYKDQIFIEELTQAIGLVYQNLMPLLKGSSLKTLCLPEVIIKNLRGCKQKEKYENALPGDWKDPLLSMPILYAWKKAALEYLMNIKVSTL